MLSEFISHNITLIEALLVIAIICVQIAVFTKTVIKIQQYKKAIPKIDDLSVVEIKISNEQANNIDALEIVKNIHNYNLNNGEINIEDYQIDSSDLSIIRCVTKTTPVFDEILNSTNTYLLRNRFSSPDFNLIKDIIERNTDNLEEEINLTISVPLYLGLMGTMMGIIIGLFGMGDLVSSTGLDSISGSISPLLNGVKIAMFASFTGLFLTILKSGWFYRIAKMKIESRKNNLYTFIQINLLPALNKDLTSTFESLQRNLFKFNKELDTNLKELSVIFKDNKETINAQKEILDKIDNIPIAQIAKYNIKVMKELQSSTDNIEKFNTYLGNINSFVSNSNELATKSNEILDRTENFKTIADNIKGNLAGSNELMEFLTTHFKDLESHKSKVSESALNTAQNMNEIFNDLKEHIKKSSDSVKNFTIEELDLLKEALSKSKTNLSNLGHLKSIEENVSSLLGTTNMSSGEISEKFKNLNKMMKSSSTSLETIKKNTFKYRSTSLLNYIKSIFKTPNK